jgi:hypothetical protein
MDKTRIVWQFCENHPRGLKIGHLIQSVLRLNSDEAPKTDELKNEKRL